LPAKWATDLPLIESEAPRDPFSLFDRWFREAATAGALQPDAVALATATRAGAPSARMVLFKGLEDGAFLFYSNYASRKGRELALNNRAALVFFWSITRHQVRVSGTVRRLSREASAEYFHSRPRGAQLSALASRQSRVVSSRDVLEKAVLELATRFPTEVPLPRDWGGYALTPRWIEFWENREDRLHDRLCYVKQGRGAWRLERLAP
jgi:pyridoxamine 5'-phosphate oxidase